MGAFCLGCCAGCWGKLGRASGWRNPVGAVNAYNRVASKDPLFIVDSSVSLFVLAQRQLTPPKRGTCSNL
jgi:hypothetical protein